MAFARLSGSLLLLGVTVQALAGCHPTCKHVCKTLLACDEVESARVNLYECVDACNRQEALYKEEWENPSLLDAFYAENNCIVDASCEEIAAGACYDPELYPYKDTGFVTETGN